LGRVVLPVKYRGRVQNIVFRMCPDLQQELYLDIHFCRALEVEYYRDEVVVVADPGMWDLEKG